MNYFTLYHFAARSHAGGNFHVSSLPPSRRASSPAGVVATTHPYVRSNMLPSVGGPGGDRRSRSRYLTPLEQQIYYWMYGHHQTVINRFF
jgi:hypothetical protein